MDRYLKQFEDCRQWEKPFCTAACPFHMEVLDFMEKMGRNSYNAAFKTFRNAVGFPDIVAALCPGYCYQACPRGGADSPVQINLLEKTCVERANRKDPTDYNVPVKNRKIGIVGGGISGLACALRLTSKKYDVTLYEKTDRLGGHLWNLLPPDRFLQDIQRQFQFETYTLQYHAEIQAIEELAEEKFEAVYVATGRDGPDFGILSQSDGHCKLLGDTALFAGGSLTGRDTLFALAEGLSMAWSIEVFLKTKKLEYPKLTYESKVAVDPVKLVKAPAASPGEDGLLTDEGVKEEAKRCVRCQCDACRVYCDLSAFHKKWPLKMRDEVMSTISPSDSLLHGTPAKRLINTCTQCGLCDQVCPGGIQLGRMMADAKKRLHKLDKMPGAFHQFWLLDMDFANGPYAALRRKAPGCDSISHAFFPGCQLGAADPDYVLKTYQLLLSKQPDTGLLLRCCGVPAEWAGNEERHKKELDRLRGDWELLGRPVLILACPTCEKKFAEYLPEIQTASLYEIMDQWGMQPEGRKLSETYSVFDPCSARGRQPLHKAVRSLAHKAGVSLSELPKQDKHGCCGYGGQVSIANPEFAKYVAEERAKMGENPYIAYCINCRDIFREEGKPAVHILDLMLDLGDMEKPLPGVTERRHNRTRLAETLLKEIWGKEMEEKPEKSKIKLTIGPEMRDKMNRLKVLEEDLGNVIEFCEGLGRRIYHPDRGTYSCFRELGYVTYWVEYRPREEAYELVNVYTHRIKIELETMWNGRKTDFDLR